MNASAQAVTGLLAKLERVKRTPSGFSALCPAHEDRTPSLSIAEGKDGRALIRCHAGCSVKAICTALEIREADLFPSVERRGVPMQARARTRARRLRLPARAQDFTNLARAYTASCASTRMDALSLDLGVSASSLARLELGWDGRAFTFPMEDGLGCVRGIRRRFVSGAQCAVRKSRNGIFVPRGLTYLEPLLVAEGASDTAALLDLAYEAIGRADCRSASASVLLHVSRTQPPAIVVVADNDQPGAVGARELALALVTICPSVRVISPPEGIKDAREWKLRGASRAVVEDAIGLSTEIKVVASRRRVGGCR